MSFFQKRKISQLSKKQIIKQTYLRAKVFDTNIISKLLSNFISEKRMSPFPSFMCKGSMAVEAAITVPLFLLFMINILLSFDMLRLHSNMLAAMHQTGNEMAFAGYAYEALMADSTIEAGGLGSVIISEGYAKSKVIKTLGTDYLDNTCLEGGSRGISFLKSSVMKEDDMIDLIASYQVQPFIKIIGFPGFAMENRYYGRAWTGYDVEYGQAGAGNREDPMVYIADTGVVYHLARNCTYLCPSIEAVTKGATDGMRNENGEKYHACERCGNGKIGAVVYITDQGNRYHTSLRCSGLKRSIRSVPLSQAGGRSRCTKCGK